MFGFFKKSKWEIKGKSFAFFEQVFGALPAQYNFLLEGLHKGLYRSYAINHSYKRNNYFIGFDPKQSDKSMIKGKNLEIGNIQVECGSSKMPMHLSIHEGLWIGFELAADVYKIENCRVDVSAIRISQSPRHVPEKVKKLVNGLVCATLDFNDLGEIELDGKTFYQIKDLADGNCIAIDNTGAVFELIHDPYSITCIDTSIKNYAAKLNKATD
jgi:hypothetical protein